MGKSRDDDATVVSAHHPSRRVARLLQITVSEGGASCLSASVTFRPTSKFRSTGSRWTRAKAGLPVLYQPSLIVGVMIAATKSIESAAVASGGTGYAVADTISLDNGIHLAVATIGAAGAITAVTVTGEGSIPANEAPPANPVAQYSTSGARHRRDLHADMGRKSSSGPTKSRAKRFRMFRSRSAAKRRPTRRSVSGRKSPALSARSSRTISPTRYGVWACQSLRVRAQPPA